ncbi:hypothetical protein PENSPDRAFT_669323 [Peniophora sp. CONT]|nr:hypothetical protein PENSPDRAFT_669323 [Peniophora sp. CONT]
MRFAVVALFFAASASAATLNLSKRDYPSCANTCLVNPDLGGCDSATDLTCVCHSQTFIDSTSECIAKSCSGSDLDQANETARQACLAVGVTITAVSSTTAAASSTAASPSASATSPAGSSAASSASVSASAAAASSTSSSSGASSTGANLLVGGAAVLGAILAL